VNEVDVNYKIAIDELEYQYDTTDASLNLTKMDMSRAVDKINAVSSVVNHPTLGNGMLGSSNAVTQSLASEVQVELRSLSSVVATKAPIADPTFTGIINGRTLSIGDGLFFANALGDATCTYLTATEQLKTGNLKLFESKSAFKKGRVAHPNGLELYVSSLDAPSNSEMYVSLYSDKILLTKDCTIYGDVKSAGILNAQILSSGDSNLFLADAVGGVTCASLTVNGTTTVITKAMVGLVNVDNTSDGLKPVSIPQQQAINVVSNKATGTELLFNTFLNSYMPPFVKKVDDTSTKVIDLSTRVDLLDGGTAPA
jgi:hypothetical protein